MQCVCYTNGYYTILGNNDLKKSKHVRYSCNFTPNIFNPQLEKTGYGGSLYHVHYVITYSSLYF